MMNGVGCHRFFLRKWRNSLLYLKNQECKEAYSQKQAMVEFKNQLQNHNPPTLLSTLLNCFRTFRCNPTPPAYLLLIRTLLRRSLFLQIPPVLHHLEHDERFDTPEIIFVTLISSYGKAGMIQEALDLFFRIPKFRCVPSAVSLDVVLSIICASLETIDVVPVLLLKSHRVLKIRLEESSFRILISALCRIKRPCYGIEMLKFMIYSGYELDQKICSTILRSLSGEDGSSEDEIVCFFNGVKKLGFVPGRMDYIAVIRALVRKGKGNSAVTVLMEMKFSGLKPDTNCYNLALKGAVEAENYANVEHLFDEMLVIGLVPDIHTFNFYIKGQCRQKHIDECMKMISAMDEFGCKPNRLTYTLLLELLCEMGDFNGAKNLMEEAESKGISLNSVTYGRMIHCLIHVRGDLPLACELLEEMIQKHHDPLPYTIDDIIRGLCEKGYVSEAIFRLNKLHSCTIIPYYSTWTLLLENTVFSDLGYELVMSILD